MFAAGDDGDAGLREDGWLAHDLAFPVGRFAVVAGINPDEITAVIFAYGSAARVALHLVEQFIGDICRGRHGNISAQRGLLRRGFHGATFDDIFFQHPNAETNDSLASRDDLGVRTIFIGVFLGHAGRKLDAVHLIHKVQRSLLIQCRGKRSGRGDLRGVRRVGDSLGEFLRIKLTARVRVCGGARSGFGCCDGFRVFVCEGGGVCGGKSDWLRTNLTFLDLASDEVESRDRELMIAELLARF